MKGDGGGERGTNERQIEGGRNDRGRKAEEGDDCVVERVAGQQIAGS